MLSQLISHSTKRPPDHYPDDAQSCVQLAENSVQRLPHFVDENTKYEIGRVLDRAADSIWQSPKLEQSARDAALGLVLSLNNGMIRQAGLHLEQLELACGRNAADTTVRALKRTDVKAKPFAICEEADTSFQIGGHGYDWQIDSLDVSSELIPAEYLARVNFIRSYGIEPDAYFVGVPYSAEKPAVSTVIGRELQVMTNQIKTIARRAAQGLSKSLDAIKEMKTLSQRAPRDLEGISEWKKLPDPVLLIGFGKSPCVLVEISRWV